MLFKKTGKAIIDAIARDLERKREALAETTRLFERGKDKAALARIHQIEVEMARLERVQSHVDPEERYELTEEDLADFGF